MLKHLASAMKRVQEGVSSSEHVIQSIIEHKGIVALGLGNRKGKRHINNASVKRDNWRGRHNKGKSEVSH